MTVAVVVAAVGALGFWAGRTTLRPIEVAADVPASAVVVPVKEQTVGRTLSLNVSVAQPREALGVNSLPGVVTKVSSAESFANGAASTRWVRIRFAWSVPQLPTASQQRGMGHALDGQVTKVIQGEPDSTWVQVGQPSPHRDHFEIDQCRRGELFPVQPVPCRVTVGAGVEQGDGQDACVNDEHGRTATRSPRQRATGIRRPVRRHGRAPRPRSVGPPRQSAWNAGTPATTGVPRDHQMETGPQRVRDHLSRPPAQARNP